MLSASPSSSKYQRVTDSVGAAGFGFDAVDADGDTAEEIDEVDNFGYSQRSVGGYGSLSQELGF